MTEFGEPAHGMGKSVALRAIARDLETRGWTGFILDLRDPHGDPLPPTDEHA